MNLKNLIKNTKKMFFNLVRSWNDQNIERDASNLRGFNARQVNNDEQIALAIAFFCKEMGRNKVSKDGLLKVTRTFIANDIKRSTPTVDKYLDILQKLGFIKMIEVGLHAFDRCKKAINCLYITINLDMFIIEEVKNIVQNLAFKGEILQPAHAQNFALANPLPKKLKNPSKRE